LKSVIDAGVPVIVFIAMFVVGTDLTWNDFRRIARQPGIVLLATAGQILLLPLLGWVLLRWLKLPPAMAQGLMLVTACPSGSMANVYTLVARANVALSVTLTAVSCLAAVVTTPLTLFVLQTQASESGTFAAPLVMQAGQLLLMLVLPILAGMGFRYRWPDMAERHRRSFLAVSIAFLVALLVLVIAQEGKQFVSALSSIAVTVALLTTLAFGAGWGIGWTSGAPVPDRFTVGMVFVVRNVGIATAIAVTALGKMEFAVFATAYFLAQTPVLLIGALLFRRSTVRDSARLAEGDRP
jgi:BASS family bile acid:Na+ symporter